MDMEFIRKLPDPDEIKRQFPVPAALATLKQARDRQIREILTGVDKRMLLIIGPCSADREDAVIDYISRLAPVQEAVREKLLIIPRIYTNKPRTTGEGYKGMAHQPDPAKKPDMLEGLLAIRRLHTRALAETGFTCADEMLYPENHWYLSDLLSYVAVGARSVENQQHRLTASGIDLPVGMKNPTSGDISVMLNAILAAQHPHTFVYRGWEVSTSGNPYAHAILRGSVDKTGRSQPNYHYEDLRNLHDAYQEKGLKNMALIVDANHSNSNKQYMEQVRICNEVMHSRRHCEDIHNLVKGLMVESYIEEGAQKIGDGVYGRSITDPCIGWAATEKLIYSLAEQE